MEILITYDCGHSVKPGDMSIDLIKHKKISRKHYELWFDLKEDFKKCIYCKIAESEGKK